MSRKRENRFIRIQRRNGKEIASGNAILIVTEGGRTEPHYFEGLRKRLCLRTTDIVVKPSTSGTDPVHIVEFALEEMKKRRKEVNRTTDKVAYNRVWVVFDAEWMEMNKVNWNDAYQKARSNGIDLAISSPCFEYWLLLHEEFTTRPFWNCGEIIDYIRKHHISDFDKTCIPIGHFIMQLPIAFENVRKCPKCARNAKDNPENPSTNVHLLVREMEQAAMPWNRILK